jgi:hypothetical protein
MEEIIYNHVSQDGMCEVKLVSDQPVREARMLRFIPHPQPLSRGERGVLDYAKVNCYDTSALSLFYGEIVYPLRGAIEVTCEGWPKMRRLAAWRLMHEDGFRVREVIDILAEWYFAKTMRIPEFAFMRKLPAEICPSTTLLSAQGEIHLSQAEWAMDKCVLVGG